MPDRQDQPATPPADMSATSVGFDFLAEGAGADDVGHRARPREQPAPGPGPPAGTVGHGSPRRGHATVVGQVRGVQQRTDGFGEQGGNLLTFRIERYDAAGNRLQPVPVQLRTRGYDGTLSDGDEVRVTGRWKDGTLHTDRVQNLTTGAAIVGKSIKAVLLVFLALVAVLAVAFVVVFFSVQNAFWDDVDQRRREFQEQADQRDRDSEKNADEQQRLFCERAKQNGATPPGC